MSLYPSLEDMKVDQMVKAERDLHAQAHATAHAITAGDQAQGGAGQPPAYQVQGPAMSSALYPSLQEYMGMNITPEMMAMVPSTPQGMQVATRSTASNQNVVAPITGNDVGLRKAEIQQGIRQVILCKDQEGKIGLRVRAVNKGVFVQFVHKDSPAALAGLRFGDQILQINEQTVAGWDTDKTMKALRKADAERIALAVRDRPFERAITLQKDSTGHVGFVFKDNKITSLVKDSSAARNGVLIEHHLLEVNGQNVVGQKEKEIKQVFDACGRTVTITIIPTFIYDHIMKNIGSGLVKKYMDHSIPDA